MQVNILEAKNKLSQLVRSVQQGEDVVIANRGKPVARLVRATEAPTETDGGAHAILDWLKKRPVPSYGRRSATEIDAAIEKERASWD